jgi:hypothetical protein
MSDNNVNATMIQFSKGFEPNKTLELLSSRKGMVWKDKKTQKDIIFRSPLLEVVYPPTPAPGRNLEYSMALRVHVTEGNEKALKHQQMFKELSEAAQESAVAFMLDEKNGKRYAKKEFSSADEFKITKFWYDNGQFYMRFRSSVSAHLFDTEVTKKNKTNGLDKKAYLPIHDDIKRYLGSKSLISVDFIPNAFYYQKKDTLYPFSLNIEKIVIWASNENMIQENSQRTVNKHGFLKGFALDIPIGYKIPDEIEAQTDVPITNVNTFNNENYTLSKVIDGAKGPVIYSRYGDSFGPTYYKANNVEIKWDIKPDPEYNSRSIVLADSPANQPILKMIREQFSKLVDTVTENSEKILGDKYDRETVEDIISNPLYSQKDVNRENSRVSLKLPREEKSDKPLFELFTIPDDGDDVEVSNELKTLIPIDMGDTCDLAEQYIGAGTICRSLIFMTKPVIVGSQVYLSCRVEQILVDPNQERVFSAPMAGFVIPGYEEANVKLRGTVQVIPVTKTNIRFSKYDEMKKSFSVMFEGDDGKISQYGVLPRQTVAFDIGLVNDPDNNQFAYRIRYNHTDDKFLEVIRAIDEGAVKYCTDNSKDIFGSQKTDKVVTASLNKGRLEKFSKKDTDKKEPYSTMKAPVYEKNGGYNIAFEAYREIKPINSDDKIDIQHIPLSKPEDLLDIFHSESKFVAVVRIRGSYVDKRIILSTTVSQVLLVSDSFSNDTPYDDDDIPFDENKNDIPFDENKNDIPFDENKNDSLSEKVIKKETKELITNKVVDEVKSEKDSHKHSNQTSIKPSTKPSPKKEKEKVESDEESDDEEEESDDESEDNDDDDDDK